MGHNVIFIRPVENVGVVYDILKSCSHSDFPVIDTDDGGVLDGTIGRNDLCILLQQRAFGRPIYSPEDSPEYSDCVVIENDHKYLPLVQWEVVERAYPKYPRIEDVSLSGDDRDCFLDLRPYVNSAALTVQESASVSVRIIMWSLWRSLMAHPRAKKCRCSQFRFLRISLQRTYDLFRSMGMRFLPVVNRHNQVVGTITRADLTPEALAEKLLKKGKKYD